MHMFLYDANGNLNELTSTTTSPYVFMILDLNMKIIDIWYNIMKKIIIESLLSLSDIQVEAIKNKFCFVLFFNQCGSCVVNSNIF